MKTWYKLDEQAGTSTPREFITKILSRSSRWRDKSFAQSVLRQGWASSKQVAVMCNMLNGVRQRGGYSGGYSGRDWDEWYDLGYEGHPGQYDGFC